jgi:hypothetical protein
MINKTKDDYSEKIVGIALFEITLSILLLTIGKSFKQTLLIDSLVYILIVFLVIDLLVLVYFIRPGFRLFPGKISKMRFG